MLQAVSPTIYSLMKGGEMDSCLSQGHWCEMETQTFRPGFEIGSSIIFPTMIAITPDNQGTSEWKIWYNKLFTIFSELLK